MTSSYVRHTGATTLVFPGDGSGSVTTAVNALGATTVANYTPTTATVTGGANVGTAGTQGYAFTQDGFWAPYTVTTAGVNGVITVDFWRNQNEALNGTSPANGQQLGQHTVSCLQKCNESLIESITLRTAAAGTLSITSPNGTVLDVYTFIAATQPVSIPLPLDGVRYRGPFGIILSVAGIAIGITFRGQRQRGNPLLSAT